MAMELDMSGGSDNFGGNDSSDEDMMDLDVDYAPPGRSAKKSTKKQAKQAGGPRNIKALPKIAAGAKAPAAAARPKTAQDTLEEIYRDIDTVHLAAGHMCYSLLI
jgi:predicted lipid-binding transport protein (Tim44 family)